MIIMKNMINKSNKTANKTISFSEGLKIVQSIQKKVEILNKNKSASTSPNEYSF